MLGQHLLYGDGIDTFENSTRLLPDTTIQYNPPITNHSIHVQFAYTLTLRALVAGFSATKFVTFSQVAGMPAIAGSDISRVVCKPAIFFRYFGDTVR